MFLVLFEVEADFVRGVLKTHLDDEDAVDVFVP